MLSSIKTSESVREEATADASFVPARKGGKKDTALSELDLQHLKERRGIRNGRVFGEGKETQLPRDHHEERRKGLYVFGEKSGAAPCRLPENVERKERNDDLYLTGK